MVGLAQRTLLSLGRIESCLLHNYSGVVEAVPREHISVSVDYPGLPCCYQDKCHPLQQDIFDVLGNQQIKFGITQQDVAIVILVPASIDEDGFTTNSRLSSLGVGKEYGQ